ncbi:MAG: heme lyase CcmF/NrfE family subunit [Gammaproteobacteria bacterium]|nr:heme lyase CcmF/NrfE family subunit [Gammaproteobacteria bacterium]
MIPELGHFALILALCLAVVQSLLPLIGAGVNRADWLAAGTVAARSQFALLGVAFVALAVCFAVNDFSVTYVAANSNSKLPLPYRISAVWGAHEGSLLLWALILGLWTTAVTFFGRNLPQVLLGRVLGVMGIVSVGFLMFMLFTSNPFLRQVPAPVDGADLNPLLQDPGLIIHPPMLYTGYVGFSVAFAFAIAALLEGRLDPAWARWTRPWTTVAWAFLTFGIALGSWWAYYELGWGGWWFWDPVENASFMPWLVGTALIHSLAATEKRGVFKNWTVLLAICAFALSLLGTFLVRSGVVTSVHAFANDPARGVFILALLGVTIGASLLLYALRAPAIRADAGYQLLSRETLLLMNSTLLTVAAGAVLLGTAYPLVIDVMGGKISVGAPYFNAVFVPLMVPVFVALGLGVLCRWRGDYWARLWPSLRAGLAAGIVLGALVAVTLGEARGLQMGIAVLLALWIVSNTIAAVRARVTRPSDGGARPNALPRAFVGMSVAHLGLAVTIIGIAASSNFSVSAHERMGAGDAVQLGGYRFRLDDIRRGSGPNYEFTRAQFQIDRGGAPWELTTEKRLYAVRDMPMTEAGIDAGFTRDLYVSLGEPLDDGDWSVRVQVKPFVRWIWLGALLMVAGAAVAASDRRYRLRT